MLINLISGLPRSPIKVDIQKFIEEEYETRLKSIMTSIDSKVEYEIKFVSSIKYSTCLAYNDGGWILIYKPYLEKYLSLLDTKKAQETFLLILLTHELLHSIILRGSISKTEYEYTVNRYTKKIIESQFPSYSYKDLYTSVRRLRLKEDNPKHQAVKDIMLFPIAEKEYWING